MLKDMLNVGWSDISSLTTQRKNIQRRNVLVLELETLGMGNLVGNGWDSGIFSVHIDL